MYQTLGQKKWAIIGFMKDDSRQSRSVDLESATERANGARGTSIQFACSIDEIALLLLQFTDGSDLPRTPNQFPQNFIGFPHRQKPTIVHPSYIDRATHPTSFKLILKASIQKFRYLSSLEEEF